MNIQRSLVAGAVAVLLAACGDSTGLGVEPEIRNLSDSFEFQVTELNNVSRTLSYTWQISGTAANVNQAGTLSSGTATLEVLDAGNTRVYLRDLTENGTFITGNGQTGNWKIRVVLTRATGTLNFRVQKRP